MKSRVDRRAGERRRGQQRPPEDRRAGRDRRLLERRKFVRAPIDLWMEEEEGQDLYFRRVGNLSLGGVYFEQTMPHRLGTHVRLKFSVPGQERIIETHGEVVSTPGSKDGMGMGLRFLSLAAEDRRLLATYIDEMDSSPALED